LSQDDSHQLKIGFRLFMTGLVDRDCFTDTALTEAEAEADADMAKLKIRNAILAKR
jgi:hypothetical protein